MESNVGLYISQFQINSLKSGKVFTTCETRKRLETINPSIIPSRFGSIGQIYEVADEEGKVQTKAKLADCFMTTFGSPDLKFVSGMGFGNETQKCKAEYEKFWKANFPNEKLDEATELFVTIWEPVK